MALTAAGCGPLITVDIASIQGPDDPFRCKAKHQRLYPEISLSTRVTYLRCVVGLAPTAWASGGLADHVSLVVIFSLKQLRVVCFLTTGS